MNLMHADSPHQGNKAKKNFLPPRHLAFLPKAVYDRTEVAFIKIIPESDAAGAVKRFYDAARARAGYVAKIIQVMSLDLASAEASIQLYLRLMKSENALSKARKEMLSTVVSNINACHY
jgi:hypothetical protein